MAQGIVIIRKFLWGSIIGLSASIAVGVLGRNDSRTELGEQNHISDDLSHARTALSVGAEKIEAEFESRSELEAARAQDWDDVSLADLVALNDPMGPYSLHEVLIEAIDRIPLERRFELMRESASAHWDPDQKDFSRTLNALLVTRTAISSPDAMITFAIEVNGTDGFPDHYVYQAFMGIALRNPSWVSAFFARADPENRETLASMMGNLAISSYKSAAELEREVEAILATHATDEDEFRRWKTLAVKSLTQRRSEFDIEGADAYARSIADLELREVAHESIKHLLDIPESELRVDAGEDPRAALEWINELDGEERTKALKSSFHGIVHDYPLIALEYFKLIPDAELSGSWTKELVEGVARIAPERAVEFAASHPVAEGPSQVFIAYKAWSDIDPSAAVEHFTQSDFFHAEANDEMIHHLFNRLARNDVEVAREMIQTLPSDSLKHAALDGVAKEWVNNDSVAAAEFASSLDSPIDQLVLSNVMERWAQLDWNQAIDWAVTNLADNHLLDQYPVMMAEAVEVADVTEASRILSDLLTGGSLVDSKPVNEAVRKVGLQLLEQGADNAVAWLDTLPVSSAETAASAVSDRWAKEDPVGVSEWLGTLESGAVRDVGIVNLIRNLDNDSERSLAWAEALSAPDLREKMISEIHGRK